MSLLLALISLGFWIPMPALAAELPPIPKIEYSTTTAEVIITAYAVRYGISAEPLVATLKCESGFNQFAWNHSDPNGGSLGVAQFQRKTFDKYSKELGLPNADVWNPLDSINVAAYMFSEGQQHQWSCFRKLYEESSH